MAKPSKLGDSEVRKVRGTKGVYGSGEEIRIDFIPSP